MQDCIRAVKLVAFVSVLLLQPSPAHSIAPPAGTPSGASASSVHYVSPSGSDSGDGSELHPWASIQHADLLVRPGDTVVVGDGTYRGDITLASSGTAQHRIVYKAKN